MSYFPVFPFFVSISRCCSWKVGNRKDNSLKKSRLLGLARTYSKRWRTFWKSPWCFDENSLTNLWMRLGALKSLPWRIWMFVKTCKYGVLTLRSIRHNHHCCLCFRLVIRNYIHICNGSPYTWKSVRSCCRCVETHLPHLSRCCGRWVLPVADDLPP